jgi:hypothetical protein
VGDEDVGVGVSAKDDEVEPLQPISHSEAQHESAMSRRVTTSNPPEIE